MNYLGIDWGTKKIGLATGSDELKIASPFLVIKENYPEKIQQIIRDENIEVVVLGQPISMSGQDNTSQKFKDFTAWLKTLPVEVKIEDERLSTKMSQKLLQGTNIHQEDDAVAAACILDGFFAKM